MKIVVIGTRGIPEIQGGVETHCQELYPRLAAMGHDVTVVRRSCYVTDDNRVSEYRGVRLVDVYAPRRKSVEAIVHTFLGVIKARRLGADIVHIHAIGPGIMAPFARLLGMRVVATNHGPDYDRDKWGRFAKFALRTGERMAAKFSNRVIVISHVIADILAARYGRKDTDLIYNGVNIPVKSTRTDYLESLGIHPGQYILTIGRFVKEKGFHDLIDAYVKAAPEGVQLVIAGDADHPDEYSESLKAKAREAGIILTGFIRGERLNEVMTNARLFVLPSYHEGLPISLLEAMSYDLDVLTSNIPANLIPELGDDDHFRTADIDALADALTRKLAADGTPRRHDLTNYNWDIIARQTEDVYRRAARRKHTN